MSEERTHERAFRRLEAARGRPGPHSCPSPRGARIAVARRAWPARHGAHAVADLGRIATCSFSSTCYFSSMTDPLSRRERQIMDVVYRLREASVGDVHERLPDAPSYSAVRALMNTLTEKGHLAWRLEGRRYLYAATVPAEEARVSALRRMVATSAQGWYPAATRLATVPTCATPGTTSARPRTSTTSPFTIFGARSGCTWRGRRGCTSRASACGIPTSG